MAIRNTARQPPPPHNTTWADAWQCREWWRVYSCGTFAAAAAAWCRRRRCWPGSGGGSWAAPPGRVAPGRRRRWWYAGQLRCVRSVWTGLGEGSQPRRSFSQHWTWAGRPSSCPCCPEEQFCKFKFKLSLIKLRTKTFRLATGPWVSGTVSRDGMIYNRCG